MLIRTSLLALDQAARVHFVVGDGLNLSLDDRRLGARQDDRSVSVRLTGAEVPANLVQVHVHGVLGTTPIDLVLDPAPNLHFRHVWDGVAEINGPGAPATVATDLAVGWELKEDFPRPNRIRWWRKPITAGGVDLRSLGCGGLTPDAVHRYDPTTDILWRGDGRRIVGAHRKSPRHLSRLRVARSETVIADGELAHVFTRSGQFKRTLSMTRGFEVARARTNDAGQITSWTTLGHRYTIDRRNDNEALLRSPAGVWAVADFDDRGRAVMVTDQDKSVATLSYDAAGGLARVVDSTGLITELERDDLGRVVCLSDSTGRRVSLTRSPYEQGYEVISKSAEGRVQAFRSYERSEGTQVEEHQLAGVTTPVRSELKTLGPLGETRVATSAAGSVATVQRSNRGDKLRSLGIERTTVVSPSGKTAAVERRTQWHRSGRTSQTVTVGDAVEQKRLDPRTHTLTAVSAEGRESTAVLDPGKSLELQTPAAGSMRIEFDINGRPRRRERGREIMTYGYDQNGRLTWTDFERWRQHLHHDEQGRVNSIETPDGWLQIARDGAGRVEAIRTPAHAVTAIDRRVDGLISAIHLPAVDGKSESQHMAYDLDGLLIAHKYSDDHIVDYERDHGGRVLNVAAPGVKIAADYDETTGKLISLASADGDSVRFSYDGDLEWAEEAIGRSAGRVERAFDDNHRVVGRRINGVPLVVEHDKDGFVASVGPLQIERSARGLPVGLRLGGLATTREFDDFGRLIRHETRFGKLATVYFGEAIERDEFGRVAKIVETAQGRTRTITYRYNEARRLEEVAVDGTTTMRLSYDANGNIVELDRQGRAMTFTVDAADRLTALADQPTAFTPCGALTELGEQGAVRSYDFDGLGRMTGSRDIHHDVSHTLDPLGRPIRITGAGAPLRLLWDGDRLAATLDAQGNVDIRFIDSGTEACPEALNRAGISYLLLKDHLGSVRAVVNAHDGQVVQAIDFDALGRPTATSALGWQPFGFAGGLQEAASGIVRFRARSYDPFIGRFLSRDPLGLAGGQTNLYQYALGDPVNNTDPSGLLVSPSGELMVTHDPFIGKRPLSVDFVYLRSESWAADVTPVSTLGAVGRLLTHWTQGSTYRHDASRSVANHATVDSTTDRDDLGGGDWTLTNGYFGPEWDALSLAAYPGEWEFNPTGWDEGPGAGDVVRRIAGLPEAVRQFRKSPKQGLSLLIDGLRD